MRNLLSIFLIISSLTTIGQGIQTPKEFYGFQPGTKVLFHHQVVEYCKYVANAMPNQVKLYKNGKTTEGRDMIAIAIASPENMARIEEIRNNNLISIELKEGIISNQAQSPAIAYLSYSVHGNEIAGTTAVSDVIYEILNPKNDLTQKILKNTVIIIDPALNPDGYDRYSSWYNQVVNANPDATPYAREHSEPWPSGRFLHYLFDPNRDWAWQVQKESENRTKFYNSWMPHLHADYHEMGPNDPYFFPPAAKPYHENITSWQKEVLNTLGEYNKKYFDKNNWLYYTKEQYDLFYPSYGDSYPMYNGAIGMTYEQGGSGVAGLIYERSRDKDTLRLTDRAAHHFVASMATLEMTSDNAEKLVSQFIAFHKNAAKNGIGDFKTFVLKTNGNEEKIIALTNLLDKVDIKYNFANAQKLTKGLSFENFKEETYKIEKNDLIISSVQAKGTLVKILFEPKANLEDSNTYDITTWALPFAYGLNAYALTEKLNISLTPKFDWKPTFNVKENPYSYLIEWKDLNSVQFLSEIQKNKIKVRVAEQGFRIDNKDYSAGTLVLTRTSNTGILNFDKIIVDNAIKFGVNINSTTSGLVEKGYDFGSDYVYNQKNTPKIILLGGEGVSATAFGEVWHYFEKQINYPISIVMADKFANIPFDKIDILILPDGNYSKILNEKNIDNIKKWIQSGGKLIAMEGAVNLFANRDGFNLKSKKDEDKKEDKKEIKYNERNRSSISDFIPGAIYKINFDESHPLAFGIGANYKALLRETYNLENLTEGWNVGKTLPDSYMVGFAGFRAKQKLKNTLIYGVEEIGKGSIVYMADGPLFRGFWHAGKMIFSNAIFMLK